MCFLVLYIYFFWQTLYKTQVRELKEECEERNKLYKDAQQSLQEMQEERWFYRFTSKIVEGPNKGMASISVRVVYCLWHILALPWIFLFIFFFISSNLSLRDSLAAQLEITLTKADSEQLARSIAEEQYSDLEKEKIMKELELKEMMARHRQEVAEKDITISSVRNAL